MITEIGYSNFKCFDARPTSIPIKGLNLLTGSNGRGKSTTLQGLLLMKQSLEHSRTAESIIFNGTCLELGTFNDIKNINSSRADPIRFTFGFESDRMSAKLTYVLKANPKDDMVARVANLFGTTQDGESAHRFKLNPARPQRGLRIDEKYYDFIWRNFLFASAGLLKGNPVKGLDDLVNFRRIHYISADRIGPKDYYQKQSFTDFPEVGPTGEFTANVLTQKGRDDVNRKLRLITGVTQKVDDQVEAWLSRIFDGGAVRVKNTEANIVIVALNSEDESTVSTQYKPTNVGFGYSYALPIIVAGLIAKPGEILIVENPEAHLHPYAQSQLAEFLVRVWGAGVQVFVETHSDHILNGFRIAVRNQRVNHTDLNILFFSRNSGRHIESISVDKSGGIDHWPSGFFDQLQTDFTRLFSI